MFYSFLQRIIPAVTAFALFINSISGMLGLGVVIPYNPNRVEVAVSDDVVTDVDEVLACYNEAIKKGGFVIGRSGYEKFEISNINYGNEDEDFAAFMETYMDIFIDSFSSTVSYSFELPGNGDLPASDIKSAKMSEKDGETTIILELVDDYAAIARTFGWDENEDFAGAFEDTGFVVSMGDYESDYENVTIACVVDDSGKIIYGDWDYDFSFSAQNIEMKIADMEMTIGFDLDCTAVYDI